MRVRVFFAVVVFLLGSSVVKAQLINDSFTYQGTLNDQGIPANGLYDVKFTVYEDEFGGFAVRDGIVTVLNVQVTDGLFEAFVDFGVSGTIFDSTRTRWLELEVKPSSNHLFETLSPRQRISPAPLANYALRAENAEHAETSGTTLHEAYLNGNTIMTEAIPVQIRGESGFDGELELGGDLSNGELSIFNYDGQRTHRLDVNSNTESGRFIMFDGNDIPSFQMYTDQFTGVGGTMTIARADGGAGFIFIGNDILNESPRMYMLGEDRTMRFDTNASGDDSVMLPNSAISALEIANEPGVVFDQELRVAIPGNNALFALKSTTINAPTAGYVLVTANGIVQVDHRNGIFSQVALTLSDDVSDFQDQSWFAFVSQNESDGLYYKQYAQHRVFPVSEGSHTFYIVGASSDPGLQDASELTGIQLSALFVPTAYGNIGRQAGHDTDGTPMTNRDIIMEQNAAIIANNQRLEREMEAMKAQMQQLINESKKNMNSPGAMLTP